VDGDTIAAAATPSGGGLRALIRLSGPRAAELARGFPGARILPAPGTYTGEPSAEIPLPGSAPLVAEALETLRRLGARPARPGEFTLRAFLHGRIDLARAEAVEQLISAEADGERRAALGLLEGSFSRRVSELEDGLFDLVADAEAAVDFPEEDLVLLPAAEAARRTRLLRERLAALRADCVARRPSSPRPRVLLYGPPNAGKTSLFNALTGAGAIVSERPGTTRDVLEAEADFGGPALLADSAGDQEAAGADGAAVRRTRAALEGADLVLLVADASAPAAAVALEPRGVPRVKVMNKADLAPAAPGWIGVSARTGQGLDALRAAAASALRDVGGVEARFRLSLRQQAALGDAEAALERAEASVREGFEFLAADAREALSALGALSGRDVAEGVLDRIFARFCLGK
jgi:tRNA modification GTPase